MQYGRERNFICCNHREPFGFILETTTLSVKKDTALSDYSNHTRRVIPILTCDVYFKRCDLCRVRKVACVVEQNASSCHFCSNRNRPCTFRSSLVRKQQHRAEPAELATGSEDPAVVPDYDLHLGFLNVGSNQKAHQDDSLDRFNQSTTMPWYTSLYSGLSGDQGRIF